MLGPCETPECQERAEVVVAHRDVEDGRLRGELCEYHGRLWFDNPEPADWRVGSPRPSQVAR